MTVATSAKGDLAMTSADVAPPVGTAVVGTAVTSAAAAPAGDTGMRKRPMLRMKLPPGREWFDAAWPPVVGVLAFVGLWTALAPMVQTSLGTLPGPSDIWDAFKGLMIEYASPTGPSHCSIRSAPLGARVTGRSG